MTSQEFFEKHQDFDILEIMEMYRDHCMKEAELEVRKAMARGINKDRHYLKRWEVSILNCLTRFTHSDRMDGNVRKLKGLLS